MISDYYSRYLELLQLTSTTTEQVIKVLKATFARFGVPEQIQSDNGSCYSSEAWKDFCRQYDSEDVTSSPHNPQGNGLSECAVQVAKRILKQEDPVLALMCYRARPTALTGVSPAEFLMGRKIRTTLQSLKKNLVPKWQIETSSDVEAKQQQAFYFNRRHEVTDLLKLNGGKDTEGTSIGCL